MELETLCDPAGMVQEIASLKEQVRGLEILAVINPELIKALEDVMGVFGTRAHQVVRQAQVALMRAKGELSVKDLVDVYKQRAARVFEVEYGEVTPTQRWVGKSISLMEASGIVVDDAELQQVLRDYREHVRRDG